MWNRVEAQRRSSCASTSSWRCNDPWEGPDVGPIVAGEQFLDIKDFAGQLDMHGLILRGYLPEPGLMTYEEWKRWRAGPGCRPPGPEGSAVLKRVFGRREGELHRELMKKMFGDRCGILLDQRLLAEEDETGNLFGQDLGGNV